jgi:hypothetical protein
VTHPIAPLFASEYVGIVQDFIGFHRYLQPDGGYKMIHNGALRTIRFDNISQFPDLQRSKGVIGYLNYQNSLYIHLSEGREQTIYLQPTEPQEVYLKYGSHYIDDWIANQKRVKFNVSGLGKAEFEIANLIPDAAYSLSILKKSNQVSGSQIIKRDSITTNTKGCLKFKTTFVGYQGRYAIKIEKVVS